MKHLDEKTIVSFLPMADLGEREMYSFPKEEKSLEEVYKGYTYFKENDVLLAKVTPCFENKKASIVKNLKNEIGFGSSEYIVLRPSEKVAPEIIYSHITSSDFNNTGRKVMTGIGGLKRVPTSFVENYEVPLLDKNSQKQLVSEMNEQEIIINSNKKLVNIMERKISEVLALL